jgi:NAD(P)-dependent dehydrogenase (short-subunit alcohol dehydrogenase family)
MFDFTDKRVLVTGGARGIGAATVTAFLAQGAKVAVGSRSPDSYERFAEAMDSPDVCAAIGDVSDQAGARAVVDAALRGLGGLDILVNSAGIFAEVAIGDITQEHWNATLATNLAGTFFTSQAALEALTASTGNIVNVASDAGLIGYPMGVAYSAAKGGVVNLTKAMAVELALRVRVNCVCPGNVDTDMLREAAQASGDGEGYLLRARERAHTKRMITPQEVAAAILYLASSEAASTTGAALPVDGGGVAGF